MPDIRCDGCRFAVWVEHPRNRDGFDSLECRRRAPTRTSWASQDQRDGYPIPGQIRSGMSSGWPKVRPHDFCGEWEKGAPRDPYEKENHDGEVA